MSAIRTKWPACLLVAFCMAVSWFLDSASFVHAGREADSEGLSKAPSKVERSETISKSDVGKKGTSDQTDLRDRCEMEAQALLKPCLNKTGDELEECLRAYDKAVNACVNQGPTPKAQKSLTYYRIPYADGTNVKVGRDFSSHNPFGRIDMHGKGGGTHRIVAAADGTVRYIQDSRSKNQWPERWFRNTAKCLNN